MKKEISEKVDKALIILLQCSNIAPDDLRILINNDIAEPRTFEEIVLSIDKHL